ncbi:hypothetical protein [Cohnella nanjingensis]|uniref:Uncharacterized protein n=1 Tax=Cohnella nanjingensis TaxID=1387779 RepID=A0A7X0VGU5_9BACL|nr:hypothetical protein [Cohnella nanjingensis]MBB6673477.1 hypothetical protein [Cohnella nanjingensis]
MTNLEFSKNASVVELKVPLSTLGISPGATIRIGYIKNDFATDRLLTRHPPSLPYLSEQGV